MLMNANGRVSGLLLGLVLVASCTERTALTGLRGQSAPAFDVAAALTSFVIDPAGDASLNLKNYVGPGADEKVPDYLDIVRAEVSKSGRTFVFTMNVADVVPANPAAASGDLGIEAWLWGLDTDPTTSPEGGFWPPSQVHPFEFYVDVEWDGMQFSGSIYDFRPLLTGGEFVVTPLTFVIEGAQLTLFVAESALDHPATFVWGAATSTRHSHFGSGGYQNLDFAPDGGLPLPIWPAP
jgi:hypothetical protein